MSDLADALRHIGIDTIAGHPVADWLADNINDLPGHYFTTDSLAAALEERLGWYMNGEPESWQNEAAAIIQAAKDKQQ